MVIVCGSSLARGDGAGLTEGYRKHLPMGNVARILKRDIMRLLKTPAALVVVAALLVLPSLYTWYNVVAFWDPYEETGNLKVCVVNHDTGTENELAGKIDVGALLTEELLKMDKLTFVSKDYDEAMADLEAGSVYAVYVVPEDFSECLVSPLTGTIKKPTIVYYSNEKLGPVTPKITDTAANTLEETINSMFVKTVSDVAVEEIDKALKGAAEGSARTRSVAYARMNTAIKSMSQMRSGLADARATVGEAKTKVDEAVSSMDDISTTISDARVVVADIADEAGAVETQLMDAASDAVSVLPGVVSKAAQIDAKANGVVEDLSTITGTYRERTNSIVDRLASAAGTFEALSSTLSKIANDLPESWSGGSGAVASVKNRLLAVSGELGEKAGHLRTLINSAGQLDTQLAELAKSAADTSADLKNSATQAVDALQGQADELYGSATQTITSTLAKVNAACVRVSAALTQLDDTIKQAQSTMRQLAGLMGDGADALLQTEKLVAEIQTDLGSITSDVRLLAESGAIAELLDVGGLNPDNISAFLGSPTRVEKEAFFHPNVYGAAMTPLFMNLTFWIGAFMLIIIFKLEVDDEGLGRVTLGQRYISRLLLFSGFAVVQAIICCIGVIAMGIHVANVPAFFIGSAVAALAYLSVIYALSTSLHHIGKALCIILVFTQIPGGSGLYPLELTDGFFQAIYPFLPFSYGIDALREAIFGFYGNYFSHDMVVLALFFFGMLAVGMVAVPLMSNVTRMAARQIREGGLFNGEQALVPARPYRFSQIVSVLSDRDDYRENLERRYARFSRLHPILIQTSIVLGVGVPLLLMVCMALDAGDKLVLMTLVLLWLVSLVVFLLVVESMRYSFERQLNIDRMSDSKLMREFFNRDRMRLAIARSESEVQESSPNVNDRAGDSPDAGEAHDA